MQTGCLFNIIKRGARVALAVALVAALLLSGGCVEAVLYSFEAERDLSIVFTNEDEFYYYGGASAFASDTSEPVVLADPELALDVALTDTTAVFLAADGLYASGVIADLPFGDMSTVSTDGIVRFVYGEADAILDDNAKFIPTDLSTAQQVAAGSNYTLVRLQDGRVYGWGSNSVGQLGASSEEVYHAYEPIRVGELEGASLIAAGSDGLAAALDMNGHVWVWGSGVEGIIRLELESLVHVACGSGFVAMLDSSGRVWTWSPTPQGGSSEAADAGGEPAGAVAAPVQVAGLPEVFSLVAGDDFLAAKDGDGGVWTWGANDVGQLGRDTGGARDDVPAKLDGIASVISLSAGRAHMMAMTQNMAVLVWGDNSKGQLGRDAGEMAYSPAPIDAPTVRMSLSR